MKSERVFGFCKASVLSLGAALCAFAARATDVTYTGGETVSTPLALEGDSTITVPAGTVVTFTAPISCSGLVTKLGTGTLRMNAACPNLTGGIQINNGGWRIGNADGFGTETVTINGGAAQFDLADATKPVPNDFVITSASISAQQLYDEDPSQSPKSCGLLHLYFLKDVTLDGSVTSANITFRMGGERYKDSKSTWPTVNFNGEVSAGTATLYTYGGTVGCYGKLHFHGKVTCATFETCGAYSGIGDIHLYAENAIDYCILNAANMYLHGEKALNGRIYHQVCWGEERGNVYLATPRVRMPAVSSNSNRTGADNYPSGSSKTGAVIKPESGAATLEVTGMVADYMTYARLQGALTFLLNAEEYPDFKETFDWVTSSTTGDLIVSNGTLRIQRNAGFPSVRKVVIGPKGSLEFASTVGFEKAQAVEVRGRLTVEAEASPLVNMASETEVCLFDGASIDLNGGTLEVPLLKLNGDYVRTGTYAAGDLPNIILAEGSKLSVQRSGLAYSDTWTGAAAPDCLMSTPGNWANPPDPLDVTRGLLHATFGADGTAMVTPPGGAFFLSLTSTRLMSAAPFVIGAKGETLTVAGRMMLKDGAQNVIRGTIATPNHQDQGAPTSEGAYTFDASIKQDTSVTFDPAVVGKREGMIPLVLDDAVIEKPVYVYAPAPGTPTLYALPGTTNEIKGAFLAETGHTYFYVERGAVIKISGGWKFTNFPTIYSPGTMIISGKPLVSATYITVDGGNLVLDAEDCQLGGSASGEGVDMRSGTLEFLSSYCLKGHASLLQRTGSKTTIEFNATTQQVARLHANSLATGSTMHGAPGSLVEIVGGRTGMALTACKDMTNTVQVTGALSFKMNAPGETFGMAGQTFQSTGDIEVAAGTMTFAPDASWTNGLNVTVSGTGVLRTGASRTFGKQAVLRFADGGVLELPASADQRVAECWVGDTKVETGIYSAADLKEGDALYGHLTSGTLSVGRLGGILLVR